MPPDMAMDMRRSKLNAEEAALLAGELKKPSWQSRNEGIHERVSFEDSIWGFDLAGGAFYKTPLRVVGVKPDSRAQKAGIRIGDLLNRINDIDTSTLTIQEAHEIIIDSGVHLRISVTAPEDEEDSYFCYQDPTEEIVDLEALRRLEEEKERKRQVHAKVSSYWSLQWPWVSKRRIIYRESNCFMVPSKYEVKHSDKFTELKSIRKEDDIVLQSNKSEKNTNKDGQSDTNTKLNDETMINNTDQQTLNSFDSSNKVATGTLDHKQELNGNITQTPETKKEMDKNGINEDLGKIQEMKDEIANNKIIEEILGHKSELNNDFGNVPTSEEISENSTRNDVQNGPTNEISSQDEINDNQVTLLEENSNTVSNINDKIMTEQNEDEFIEILDNDENVEDDIVSSLSDSDERVLVNSDAIDER